MKPFTIKIQKLSKVWWVILLFLIGFKANAQVDIKINSYSTFTPGLTTVNSGEYWEMALNYSISDTQTGSVSGVVANVTLPDFINDATGFVGTDHALASGFTFSNTPGNKKLTINFVDNVPTGSSGVLKFKIRTTNGITPNGTTINTCAQLTHPSGANSGAAVCHNMGITAQASLCGFKSLKSGGAIDNMTTYKIFVGYGGTSDNVYNMPAGTLNSSNITFTDTYPAGAEFISAKVYNLYNVEQPTTVTQGANSVTVTLPDYVATPNNGTDWAVTNVCYVEVTLKYNSAAGFTNGQSVTNSGSVTFSPFGGSPVTVTDGTVSGACTSDLVEMHNLTMSTITATLVKNRPSVNILHPNENLHYIAGFSNTGNVALDNVEIIETVPSELIVANGGLYNSAVFFADVTKIAGADYQTNLNASWANWPLSGDRLFLPTLGAGEYITKYRIRLVSPFSASATTGEILLNFIGGPTSTSIGLNNCLEWSSTTANLPANRQACNNEVTLEPTASTAKVFYTIGNTPGCAGPYAANQVFDFWGNVKARTGYAGLQNPTVAMFLPAGFDYVSGSETFEAMTSGISTNPTLTVTPNFGGGTRTLYRWTFPNGTVLPAGTEFKVHVNIKAGAQLVAGTNYSQETWFMVEGSNIGILEPDNQYAPNTTDQYDWDGDGNTTETFRPTPTSMNSCSFIVTGSASLESIKWVKGLCDTQYSRYPAFGQTVPGGNADYKLIVKNTGNVTIKDIKIIDILPFIGDNGVLVTSQARNTEWKPNLADAITAPAGVTVYYSTASNPCRDEIKGVSDPSPFPTGCTPANWSVTPPANITTVMSVKIDFGATKLAGGDSLVFSWPMRAPVNAPTGNQIAWNSFAYVGITDDAAQSRLSAEPPKVGIKVKGSAPAYYGNRVWFDTNHNGIQDETSGVDGVKVKLFQALGGTPNPASDPLINFTITGNGGYYKFSNLLPGNYYAIFCLPNGYLASPTGAGTPTTDSDGSPTTYQGLPAYITPITTLDASEDDDSWDQGIYCAFTPTVTTNSPVPVGGTLTMSVDPATGSYAWAGPGGWTATGASVTRPNMTAAEAGGYAVNVTQNPDGTGCWASLNIEVVVGNNPCSPPTPIPQGTSICDGSTATLTVTGCDATYPAIWYSDNTYTTQVGTGNSFTSPVLNASTNYFVACVKDATCKSAPVTVSANVAPKPISGTSTVTQATCNQAGTAANNDAKIEITSINNATSYAYTADGSVPVYNAAQTVTTTLTLSPLPNPLVSTTYKIRLYNGSADCYTEINAVLEPKTCTPSCVSPNVATPTATQATCNQAGTAANNDASVSISAISSATSYAYTTDGSTPTFASAIALSGTSISLTNLANPATATTYKFRVFNGTADCFTDVSVILNPKTCTPSCVSPNVATPTATQATCNAAGTAVNNDASVSISAISSATSYAYTTDGSTPAFASAVAIPASNSISLTGLANPAAATTYKFRVFNGTADCFTDVSVILNPRTCTPNCTPPTPISQGKSTCEGNSTTLTVTGCDVTYPAKWYINAAMTTEVGTGNSFTTPTLTATTSYYVACVKDANCKSSSVAVMVTVLPKPTPIKIGTGETYTLTVEAGTTSIQWFKDGIAIAGAAGTASTLTVTNYGSYTYSGFKPNGDLCRDTLCCPIVFVPVGSIGDYVWKDTNNNGIQDETTPNGGGVAGVQIELYKNGTFFAKDTTDATGKYLFTNLEAGTYKIKVLTASIPAGCEISSIKDAPNDDAKDSDVDKTTGESGNYILDPIDPTKKDILTVDAALVVPCVKSKVTLTGAPVCSADVQTYSITFSVSNKVGAIKVNKGSLTGANPYTVTGIPSGATIKITDSLSAVCKFDTLITGPNCNCNPALPIILTPSMTVCAGDTFPTTKATVVGLATVEWFAQASGGTAVFTGLNYKPSGTVPTTGAVFYAQARSTDPTCPTAVSTSRVMATINAQDCTKEVDLALKKSINTKIAQIGDMLTYTLKVWNESNTNATGVEVTDSIATTVQAQMGSFVASRGSVSITGNVIKWTIGNIAAAGVPANGDTVTLTYRVKATQEGVHFNTAEISKVNEKDKDSTPSNAKDNEDDIDRQCFSVPIKLCTGAKVEASVSTKYTNVQWFKDGGSVPIAFGNVVLLSGVGIYTYTASNQTCPSGGCCPIIIEAGVNCCSVDLCIPVTVKKKRK